MSFLGFQSCPVQADPPEAVMAAKTLGVSVAVTQNPAGAPTPQAILVAISSALSDPAFNTVAPWSAVVTITSS
jgi:hypothetical protein